MNTYLPMKQPFLKATAFSLTSLAAFLFAVTPKTFAMQADVFQHVSCPNPGGNQIANFQDGWHAIVGSSQNMWGKDTVQDMGNQNFVQCFCPLPLNGQQAVQNGIQTDWRFAGNMSTSEQQEWMNSGWQLRHDGTAFGLPQNDFLVKNFSFSCNQSGSISSSTTTNCNTTISQSNTTTISNKVNNFQQTGNNEANNNTQGNVQIINGNATNATTITNTTNANIQNSNTMKEMIRRIIVHIQGNGATSRNAVVVSSN